MQLEPEQPETPSCVCDGDVGNFSFSQRFPPVCDCKASSEAVTISGGGLASSCNGMALGLMRVRGRSQEEEDDNDEEVLRKRGSKIEDLLRRTARIIANYP